MELGEAISLIQTDDITKDKQTVWADLGCGSGLFTRALAGLLNTGSSIYAIDKNISSFQKSSFPNQITVKTVESDFVKEDLNLKNLDGILMANALHFVRNKKSFIEKTIPYFRSAPAFVIVEYDTNLPNPWVPYPLGFTSLKKFFSEMGYTKIRKINEKKSRYRTSNLYSVFITR